MSAASPQHAVELMDRAFNEGNIEALLSFSEESDVIVTEPGKTARGTTEIQRFFEEAMKSGAVAKQLKMHVIEADGVALFLSRWTLAPQTFVVTTVFRRQANGTWKALIDNFPGPLVFGAE